MTAIVVLGLPRSGTSAVAGTLHRMGVDMGEGHLQVADDLNSRGYYEDTRWSEIAKWLSGVTYSARFVHHCPASVLKRYADLIAQCETNDLWGFKNPRTCFVLHHIAPLLDDAKLVVVRRDFEDVVGSLIRHSHKAYNGAMAMNEDEARAVLRNWRWARDYQIQHWDVPLHSVRFEDLLRYPHQTAEQLWEFVGSPGEPAVVAESVAWIDSGMVTQ